MVVCTCLPSAAAAAPAADAGGLFTLAAGGDLIGPYTAGRTPHDPQLQRVATLFRHADLGYANQEGSLFDLATFTGYPAAENGGGYPLAPQAVAFELKALGISIVSKANNHATDWGVAGLLATLRSLSAAAIVQAGAGTSEATARAPAYVDTAAGRIALISTASTFPPMSVAGPAVTRRGQTSRPRPGISVLHLRAVHDVQPGQLQALEHIAGDAAIPADAGAEVRIDDQFFRVGSDPGTQWEADPTDEAAILAAIRAARQHARYVIFAIHAHQTAGDEDNLPAQDFEPMILHRANEAASPDDPRPAPFEVALFHAAIDAGADLVIRTGPHTLNGIEIYHGRPIFYSLGSLFFDFGGRHSYTTTNGEPMRFPDEWFETMVAVTRFRDGRLLDIRLYPLSIQSAAGPTGGAPHPADPHTARRILERVRAESAVFGTNVQIRHGVGVVQG